MARWTEDDLDDMLDRLERLERRTSGMVERQDPYSTADDEMRRVLLPLLVDALRRPAVATAPAQAPAPAPAPADKPVGG